jgi:hypothetical protein
MRASAFKITCGVLSLLFASSVAGGEMNERELSRRAGGELMTEQPSRTKGEPLTACHTILDLLNHPAFAGFVSRNAKSLGVGTQGYSLWRHTLWVRT